jgi:all-trans-retinol dehydrogenase (NAD+)
MTEVAGRNVLITGAASGIGRLLALKAGALGSRLVLWDIDESGLESVQAELVTAGCEARIYVCDLQDRAAIERTARHVLVDHGGVDILINNAGVVTGKYLLETSDEEIIRTMEINALAPIYLTRAFLPAMMARDSGHIVNISSAAGIVASARLTDYCASKFALFGFDEALRIDLRRLGSSVRSTIVCPFYIDTGMFAGVKTRFPWLLPILDPQRVAEKIIRAILSNRRRLVMPWFVYVSWPIRLLPVALFDALADFFGISRSMDDFTGRQH